MNDMRKLMERLEQIEEGESKVFRHRDGQRELPVDFDLHYDIKTVNDLDAIMRGLPHHSDATPADIIEAISWYKGDGVLSSYPEFAKWIKEQLPMYKKRNRV